MVGPAYPLVGCAFVFGFLRVVSKELRPTDANVSQTRLTDELRRTAHAM